MGTLVGVDVGGTFTDFLVAREGGLSLHKRPSTPRDPAQAVLAGLEDLGLLPDEVVHGSTVATNALLERKGARAALITTAGFRDVLLIGRGTRPRLYDLEPQRPPPLIPDALRLELRERVDHQGRVLAAPSPEEVARLLDDAAAAGAESLAVCLLHAYRNPEHERLVAAAARARGLPVSVSHEVLPEYREYERTVTTAVNAYVSPVMSRYLDRLGQELARRGVRSLRVMQSNGGSMAAETAGRLAVRTVLSGPAGGVVGALRVARAAGFDRVITFDMGGTSTDVALCPGVVPEQTETVIGGLPVRTPAVDVHTVGAGGGSLARVDAGGALRVGPESAGADPGPACYGRGTLPTVTDAHVVLGRLRPERFLGGRMLLDAARARAAFADLAAWYGGDPAAAAAAVIRVANHNMERAVRVVSVERGHDPREFALVAFGGAGPLHACDLADALRIPRVVVPRFPGVLSAFGMLAADVARDFSEAVLAPVPEDPAGAGDLARRLEARLAGLEERARREMAAAGEAGGWRAARALDVRYQGQSYELTIPVEAPHPDAFGPAFHQAHRQRYGHAAPGRPLEVVALRLKLWAPGPELAPAPAFPDAGAGPSQVGEATVWFDGPTAAAVHDRDRLRPGDAVAGPALVTQLDATTAIPPGWRGTVDGQGNLILERGS